MQEVASEIVARLQGAGFGAFWVGGCVRDFLLGREPQDFDIATDAKPAQVEELFPKTIPVGRKFGVVIVVEDGQQFQVATFRAEADYRDGRRPERVVFANAEADASRRDFTVNGLFYDPLTKKIHDWVGGAGDLRAGIIRTIGAPEERFGEDHLRMLRAVRFAARLGFAIEPKTFAAVQSLAPKIKLISAERVRDELMKLFSPAGGNEEARPHPGPLPQGEGETPPASRRNVVLSVQGFDARIVRGIPAPALPGERENVEATGGGPAANAIHSPAARGLELLRDSGLLEQILPELAATIGCEQSPNFHPEGSVFNHIRLMLEKMAQPSLPGGLSAASTSESLPWAVLLHDVAKPVTAECDAATGHIHFYGHEKVGAVMAEKILQRLRFPKKQTDEIVTCVLNHMQFKDVKAMRKATLRRLLMRDTFPLELELHRLECLVSYGGLEHYEFMVGQAEALKHQPSIRPPLLSGDDLLALGLPRGRRIGELLHDVREKQLADELKTPDEALAWVKTQLPTDG